MTSLLTLLYVLVKPDGKYHPGAYKSRKRTSIMSIVSVHQAQVSERPQRFENLDVNSFQVGTLLGEGTQGKVYKGSYKGVDCAGKFFVLEDPVKV